MFLRRRLIGVIINKNGATFSTEPKGADKKLDYYRKLNDSTNNNPKPKGWDEAIPFEKMPGPSPLPIIGNMWRFMVPKIGDFYKMDPLDIQRKLHEEYGDVVILKGLPGVVPMVNLFNASDFETSYRNEGAWPVRRINASFQFYRALPRKDDFDFGMIARQGEDWFKIRTTVNPVLMQPKNIIQYVDQMNLVADQLIENIGAFAKLNQNGEMPADFNNELYKWALESVGVVTLDRRLGCLKRDLEKDSEPQKLIDAALAMFQLMQDLDFKPSLYRFISTPTWRKYVSVIDFIVNTNLKYVRQKMQKEEKTEENRSVLEKLLKLDEKVAVAMSVDMMIAGIDTTGKALATILYYLARYPEKQQLLRNEALKLLPEKNSPVTKKTITDALYTKAVIKEAFRLSAVAICNLRTTVKDIVLGGYQIPKGTDVLTCNLVLCTQEKNFPRAKEYIPERWMSNPPSDLERKNTNMFIFAPFGLGPRACPGQRIANLELETAILKIVRNFELTWPHEEMVFETQTMHGIARPLKIHVKPLTK